MNPISSSGSSFSAASSAFSAAGSTGRSVGTGFNPVNEPSGGGNFPGFSGDSFTSSKNASAGGVGPSRGVFKGMMQQLMEFLELMFPSQPSR